MSDEEFEKALREAERAFNNINKTPIQTNGNNHDIDSIEKAFEAVEGQLIPSLDGLRDMLHRQTDTFKTSKKKEENNYAVVCPPRLFRDRKKGRNNFIRNIQRVDWEKRI